MSVLTLYRYIPQLRVPTHVPTVQKNTPALPNLQAEVCIMSECNSNVIIALNSQLQICYDLINKKQMTPVPEINYQLKK